MEQGHQAHASLGSELPRSKILHVGSHVTHIQASKIKHPGPPTPKSDGPENVATMHQTLPKTVPRRVREMGTLGCRVRGRGRMWGP